MDHDLSALRREFLPDSNELRYRSVTVPLNDARRHRSDRRIIGENLRMIETNGSVFHEAALQNFCKETSAAKIGKIEKDLNKSPRRAHQPGTSAGEDLTVPPVAADVRTLACTIARG